MSDSRKLIEYFGINIRNERFTLKEAKSILVKIDQQFMPMVDLSESGISIEVEKELPMKDFYQINLLHKENNNEKNLIELKGQVVRTTRPGDKILYGFKFVDQVLPENFVQNLKYSNEIMLELKNDYQKVESLNPEFLINCAYLKNNLIKLRTKCEEYEKINYIQSLDSKNASVELALNLFGNEAIEMIKKYAHRLDKALTQITTKDSRLAHAEYFRNHLGEFFFEASFTGRAYLKPRGYAGDYEMMNQIYRNQAEGRTLFEKIIHLYGINEASSVSVRLRKEYLKKKLFKLSDLKKDSDADIVVGTLACGPAREIYEFLKEENPDRLKKFKFILMDQDHHALLNARRNILQVVGERKLKCEINLLPLSVKQVLDQSDEAEVLSAVEFDFLYTAGLYDYLPQTVAKNLTTLISRSVKKGGELIIGNFHPDNPTKTISDLVADWRLIHRNHEQMLDLIGGADFKKHEFYLDEIGIDLFIEAYK